MIELVWLEKASTIKHATDFMMLASEAFLSLSLFFILKIAKFDARKFTISACHSHTGNVESLSVHMRNYVCIAVFS